MSDEDAILRLAEGPPVDVPWRPYTIRVAGSAHDIVWPRAKWDHFPDASHPSHLLVWTPGSVHCIDYHSLDYGYTP